MDTSDRDSNCKIATDGMTESFKFHLRTLIVRKVYYFSHSFNALWEYVLMSYLIFFLVENLLRQMLCTAIILGRTKQVTDINIIRR